MIRLRFIANPTVATKGRITSKENNKANTSNSYLIQRNQINDC